MIIDELIALLGYDVTGENELRRFNAGLDATERHARGVVHSLNTMGVALGSFLGTIAADLTYRVASAVGSLPGDILDVGKQFEALDIRLNTLEGSAEKGRAALEWIKDFARTTPLELAQVADAYANLRNFGIDPTNGSLQALTDAMAGSGKGVAMLDRLVIALGQAYAKQKLQGEEILQLTEAGIPVWDLLAKATGKNVQELQKLSSEGKLGRDVIDKLIVEIGGKYIGASKKFAESMEGITSNLSDNWTFFLKQISDAGFYDDIKRRLRGFLDLFDRFRQSGTLDRVAKSISNFLTGVLKIGDSAFRSVGRIVRGIGNVFGVINDLVKDIDFAPLGVALAALAVWFAPVTAAVTGLYLALDDFLAWMEGSPSVLGSVINAWPEIGTIIQGWADDANASLNNFVKTISDGLKNADWQATGETVGKAIADAIAFSLGTAWDTAVTASDLGGKIAKALMNINWIDVGAAWINGLKAQFDLFSGILSGLAKELGTKIGTAILDGMKAIGPAIREWLESIVPSWAQPFLNDVQNAQGNKDAFELGKSVGGMVAEPMTGHGESIVTGEPMTGRGRRVVTGEPIPERFGRGTETVAGGSGGIYAAIANLNANLAKMTAGAAAGATITDARQDNRSFPITVNAPTTVNVQQATQAAAAAVGNVGAAVSKAAVNQASRIEQGPSF